MSYTPDQLAFHLSFNEPTGMQVYDDSPAGRNFRIAGSDLNRVTGPYLYEGLWGYTGPYTFTGPDQCTGLAIGGQDIYNTSYIRGETGTTGDVTTGDFSLALWISPQWDASRVLLNNYNICSKYPEEFFPYFEIGLENDHWYCYVDFHTHGQYDTLFTQGTHTLHEQSWMHIAFTIERTTTGIVTKFYQNGLHHNSDVARGANPPYTTRSLSNNGPFRIFKVQENDMVEYGHHVLTDFWFFNNYLLNDTEVYSLYKVLG